MIKDATLTTRPTRTLGEIADLCGLHEVTGHPTWRDIVVTSVRQDNRRVLGGSIFVALPGAHVHGARFAADALARGAVAVVTDEAGTRTHQEVLADAPPRLGPDAPFLVPDDPATLTTCLAAMAAEVLDRPAERLNAFAVTGTNGKTTVAYMIEHVLALTGRITGLVGTVETRVAGRSVPATLTTPQAVDLQHLLAEMVDAEVTDLAMEASSHALALGRVDAIRFAVAGFTNLTQDHLDFHETLEEYFAVKASLLDAERSERGVVLLDDRWGLRLYTEKDAARPGDIVPLAVHTTDPEAQRIAREYGWSVTDVVEEPTGTSFTLRHADGRALATSTALPGSFNVANAALALTMVIESPGLGGTHADQAALDELAAALDEHGGVSPQVPGRMEVVEHPQGLRGPRVIVDFAHNPGAMESALNTLRATTTGRLLLLIGAAGQRDVGKRPDMGRIAVLGADEVIITDDDPHDEDPATIRAAVLAGAHAALGTDGARATRVREIAPREDAIRILVHEAHNEDTVLLAGRGHETFQDLAGTCHPIDDRVEAARALSSRSPHARSSTA